MQLDDRVMGLERKLARTTAVVYLLVVVSLGLLGSHLYLASRKTVSFERLVVTDSIEIGDQQRHMTLDRAMLKIAGDEAGEVVLVPGSLKVGETRLTGEKLYLSSGPSLLIAEVSADEAKLSMSNQSGNFSVYLGGKLGGANLALLGPHDEAVSGRAAGGEAVLRVSTSKSTTELKP